MTRKPFAFISYSRKDIEVARYLQERIEKYVYPKDCVADSNRPEDDQRVRPVFLDLTDLSVQARHFDEEIREHLAASRYLIVICSPHSAQSAFVHKEINHFLSTHDHNTDLIIPVYVDKVLQIGHPQVDAILSTRNCPIYMSGKGEAGHIGRKYCFYHLMEFLLKVDFDKLLNRYEEYKQRRRRNKARVLTAMLLILFGSLSFGWYKQYRATQAEHNLAVTEHDLAQFEKETFPFSLVVGYIDNFLAPTLAALEDSLAPAVPHIIVMMPDSYGRLNERARKDHFRQTLRAMERDFGFQGFATEEVKIKSRRRASSIVRMRFSGIATPVYHDFASTVRAIQSVVDYKFDVNRHQVKIDTTAMSRDEMAKEYARQFVRQAKDRLGKDSTHVHFIFSQEELLGVLASIKKQEARL